MDQKLLAAVTAAVDAQRQNIFDAMDYIWKHPETGYKEWETHRYMADAFTAMGYEIVPAGDVPGFYADLDTGRPGPFVLVMGELDSLICVNHPERNPETNAVHACGHHAQCASLLGAAAALRQPEILSQLSGKIRLMAVPAEELLELTYREELRRKGTIRYMGGKVEFLYRGYMDGVDVAVMIHTGGGVNHLGVSPGQNGCIAKTVIFQGKASHAGGNPAGGINALYAATLAMNAANALRETFKDNDHIRYHPIIVEGGTAVNAIPDRVVMESYVRGATFEAMQQASEKINRAVAGAAVSMGANAVLCDRPGYMPVQNDPNVYNLAKQVMTELVGEENVGVGGWGTGCTDMGDISCVIPAIHPHSSGAAGAAHGCDYRIADPESAGVLSAKYLAAMTCALMENGGAEGLKIRAEKNTLFANKEDFFKAIDPLFLDQQTVTYGEGDTATLVWGKKL